MFKHGKATSVYLGAVDLSAYLNSADLSADLDTADSTTFHATWRSSIGGMMAGAVDLGGLYDPDEASLPTLLTSLVPGSLTYCPAGGSAVGDEARLVSAIDTSYKESSPVGGLVAVSASLMATGAVGFGSILHPLAVDTGTTTGSTKNELAASATGWTAHLHVTAVSSGSWVVTIEDSSTGSSGWALVSGATFTAATTPTSQRLTAASTTAAVKQYVRYVATVTGGTSPTITFALAFARNV
jgi:hypothetical protein